VPPDRERPTVAFLNTNPFRLLGVDPTTKDSDVDLAYNSSQHKPSALKAAYEAVKDPSRRLQAELTYPLDCPSDLHELFNSDTPATLADAFLRAADRFPPLTRSLYLTRSMAGFADATEFVSAVIDAQAAIDPMEIYQTLQRVHHSAGRPAPSLANVREGLDDLLAAQQEMLIVPLKTVEAAISALLQVNGAKPFARDRARAEILLRILNLLQEPIRQKIAKANTVIKEACNELRQNPDDGHRLDELAQGCSEMAFLSDAIRQLGAAPLPFVDNSSMWEQLSQVVDFLLQQQRHVHAQKVMNAVTEALRPYATDHAQALDLAGQIQDGDAASIEADKEGATPVAPLRKASPRLIRFGLPAMILLLAAITLFGAAIAYWRAQDVPSTAVQAPRMEPELLPPASRGQRYKREFVRYCLYQEERLRVVRQNVQGPDDTRAYNALATDWNSRCADYFYQDEDLQAVREEIPNRQTTLKADAERILSTWPWRSTATNPTK